MSGPWERFAPAAAPAAPGAGPWTRFAPAAAAPEAAPSAGPLDYLSQSLSGFNEGLAKGAGLPVDVISGLYNSGARLSDSLFHTSLPRIEHPFGGSEMLTDVMAPTIKPESADPSQQVVRRIAQELGAAAIPMGGVASAAERPLASLAGQVATTLGSGAGAAAAQQIAPNNPWAELAGEILGGAGVGIGAGLVRKAITPMAVSPERQVASAIMRRNGIDLTAGQVTGSKPLKYLESELGGNAASDVLERQSEQFTSAALGRAGIAARRATPDVLDNAFTDIGHEFDTLAARNTLMPDGQLSSELGQVVHDYNALTPPHSRAPVVTNVLSDLIDAFHANNGQISGAAYQALRSRLDKAARAAVRSDPHLSDALFGIRNGLDDAMERSIGQANPDDLGLWQDARGRYRNLLVIEKAATGAGENAALGLISPAQLRAAVVNQGRRAYARGDGDFGDLARAGVATMTPLPNSGTAGRLGARGVGLAARAGSGAFAGSTIGGPIGTVAGALLGAFGPWAAGRAVLSRAGRAYLTNQIAPTAFLDRSSAIAPVAAALVNQAQPRQPLAITVGY